MDQDTKPTYEELEQALRRHERWSWKRAMLAVGFGSILPVLLMAYIWVCMRPTQPRSESLRAHAGAYEKADAELAIMTMKRDQEAKLKAVASRTAAESVASLPAKTEALKEQAAPNASEAILGLFAISVFGLGALAFRKREVHAGWGLSAATGVVLGIVLTIKAVDAGSFLAFDAFLSLKPAELFSLSVGHLGLILIAFASGVLGLLQVPNLLHAILTLIGAILSGVGRGIGYAASSYGSFCWFLACKATH